MHKRIKLLLTALIAAMACSMAAGSASANRSIEVSGGPSVLASARLTFIGTEGGSSREITCDITLHRTITRNIPKIRGTLFGKVTAISVLRGIGSARAGTKCVNGSFVRDVADIVPLSAPRTPCVHREDGTGLLRYDCSRAEAGLWKLIYDSFQGTLPRITGINFHIKGVRFRLDLLELFGGAVNCLYEGEAFGLIRVRAEGTITNAEPVRSLTSLRRIEGSALCPGAGSFEGAFTVEPTLTIRLI